MTENSTQRRDSFMAALSAAEHITSSAPALPTDFTVHAGSLEFYFHDSPEDLVAFARWLEAPIALAERHNGRPRPYLEASGRIGDVSVRAWSLGDEQDLDRYRAAQAPVALPSEWSVAVIA